MPNTVFHFPRFPLPAVLVAALLTSLSPGRTTRAAETAAHSSEQRFLYVATPGVRNYLEYGGHGILVFDMDRGHRFVKRIPTGGYDDKRQPLNVKGICASASLKRVYVSTLRSLLCMDLKTDALLWEKFYEGGCDRMAISPDGKVIYLPTLESDFWHVVDAETGDVLHKVTTRSGAHNTIYSLRGDRAYLAGLRSPLLYVTETKQHTFQQPVGPFSASIRPFTVNGRGTLCFVNVNGLLGFEVGSLTDGTKLYRVEVKGYPLGPVKRHGCPSHGIGLTPDEKELWLTDAPNSHLHIFDATVLPPRHVASIPVRDQPGWITFSLDGKFAYPSTGEVIDVRTRQVLATLKDETGADVQSEKMVEIDFRGSDPVRVGDQFGLGRVIEPARQTTQAASR